MADGRVRLAFAIPEFPRLNNIPQTLPPTQSRLTAIIAVLLLIGVAFAVHWPELHQPVNRDISAYATIGARMLHRQWPYRDLFDHKQPLIYGVFWLLATVAPRSNLAIQASAAAVHGLTAAAMFLLLAPLVRRPAALGSALLFLVISAAPAIFEGTDFNTEHLLSALACIAVLTPLTFRDRVSPAQAIVAGLLAAACVLAKAIGVFLLPAIVLALLLRRRAAAARLGLIFTCAFAVPGILLLVTYWLGHALGDLMWANVVYNLKYVAANHPQRFGFGEKINALLIVAFAVLGFRLIAKRGRDVPGWTLFAWLVGAIAGAKIGRGDFPHYYVPIVAPAVISACLPVQFARRNLQQAISAARAVAVLLIALPFARDDASFAGLNPAQVGMQMFGEQSIAWNYQRPVGKWLRGHSHREETLFVAGAEAGFYWQSGLRPATKYLYDYVGQLLPGFYQELAQTLDAQPPRFIILPEHRAYCYISEPLLARYDKIAEFGPVRVYRFRS